MRIQSLGLGLCEVNARTSDDGRKTRYRAVFINKLTDASQEASETQTWLEFALNCSYINTDQYHDLDDKYEHIFAMLHNMEKRVYSFCP